MFPKSLKITTISLKEALKQTWVVLACCAACGVLVACADVVFNTLMTLVTG